MRHVKLNILHTESSPGWGGQEMRILLEARAMRERGYRVMIACMPRSRLAREARKQKIPVHGVSFRPDIDWSLVRRLRGLFEKERIDIVNSHSEVDSWAVALAAEGASGLKVVRTRHLSTRVRDNHLIGSLYHGLTDAVITEGAILRKRFIRESGFPTHRVFSIPTGVDLIRFNPARHSYPYLRRAYGLSSDLPLIGTVAMLRRMKGHAVLLEAFRKVLRMFPRAVLIIVGDIPGPSPLRSQLANQVRRLHIQDHVIFAGYREDIPEILASLDCFVLASTHETMPQAVAQALAMARPVVATDVGAVSEFVIHQITGILVPPRNSRALAAGIISVLRSRRDGARWAERGRRLICRRYGLERMADKVESLYQRLANGNTL